MGSFPDTIIRPLYGYNITYVLQKLLGLRGNCTDTCKVT